MAADFVSLNVSGEIITTSASTLSSVSPFFSSLLSDRFPSARDANNAILIDRDPSPLRAILSVLRTGSTILPPTLSPEAVHTEAEFYGIDPSLLANRLKHVSDPSPPPNPGAMGGSIHSDGFYVLLPSSSSSSPSSSSASASASSSPHAENASAAGGFTHFVQMLPHGRTNVIAPKTRSDPLATIGTPLLLVLGPTVRFTHHSAGSMFLLDEHELTVQDFGVETNTSTRFTAFHGVIYPHAIVGPTWKLQYFPSEPPLPGHVYHVQLESKRHTQGSNVVMLQFTPDSELPLGDPAEEYPGPDPDADQPELEALIARTYTGPSWARGSLSYTECKHTIHAMRFVTARYRLKRVRTRVAHDLRGRSYVPVDLDDQGNVTSPPPVYSEDDTMLEDEDLSCHAPVGNAEGTGLLWLLEVADVRFRNARVICLGPLLVEEILGAQAVYVAAVPETI